MFFIHGAICGTKVFEKKGYLFSYNLQTIHTDNIDNTVQKSITKGTQAMF